MLALSPMCSYLSIGPDRDNEQWAVTIEAVRIQARRGNILSQPRITSPAKKVISNKYSS